MQRGGVQKVSGLSWSAFFVNQKSYLPPDTRSKPHNLLLVAITEGKPKNLQLMF